MITVDESDPTPLFEQIRRGIADAITTGLLADGARLPAVRQLASDLRIAPGTVARAYAALEGEGRVTTSRATGTRVRAAASDPALHAAARALRRALPTTELDEALAAVRAAWAEPPGQH